MRILQIIHNLDHEGAQVVIRNLVLAKSTNTHIVCAWKRGGKLEQMLTENGIAVYASAGFKGLKQLGQMLAYIEQIVRDEKIDLIHAHMSDAAFWGAIVAYRRKIPLVITHHSNKLVPEKAGLPAKLVNFALLQLSSRLAGRNIAVATPVATQLACKLRLKPDRLQVIENGVPLPSATDLAAAAAEKDHTGYSILAVGRLVELKGHTQMIAALPKVLEKYPRTTLTLIGSGPLKEQLYQQAALLSVEKNVIFTGSINNVDAYLRQADLYLSCSHYEGLPMATLEAMGWQLPVIASDVVGNRDVVADRQTGLLYPLGDIEKLTAAILLLLGDRTLSQNLAQKARRNVEKKFGVQLMAKQYADVYQQLSSVEL